MSLLKRTGAVLVALFLTLTLVAPQTARADTSDDASITNASKWIADTWKADVKRTKFFAAGTTADGIIALSAANQQPDTVRSMLLDLKDRGPNYTDFDGGYPAGLAKMIMTADIAGQNPRTLFGCQRDLVAELKAMVVKRPAQSGEYWGPYLIAIALSRANEQVPAWVIEEMQKNQDASSGGFGYYYNDGTFVGDPDYTAVAISAMDRLSKNPKNAAYAQRAKTSITGARAWSANAVNQKQDAASSSYYWETYSSSNSTGMLAGALGEIGVDITSPARYLKSQQNPDGGWAAAHKQPGQTRKSDVMATTQAVLGVVGGGYGTARSTQVPEMEKCNTTPVKPTPPKTVYNTPGDRTVNGRNWRTTCEPYSKTTRCRTLIEATTVSQVNGRFVTSKGYVFNNLTYLPSPRSLWKSNPLGYDTGSAGWIAADGRKWRTECDTALTGRNGCRTFAVARVIETISRPGQPTAYTWVTKEIFNNMVQFS
ncbi:MAG: hypothetical protein ABIS84_08575 [Arachnia sp.]